MNAVEPSLGTPTSRSWLLIGSLALNLLIIGSIAGAVLTHGWRGGRRGPFGPHDPLNFGRMTGDQGLRGFGRSLPAERRNAIKASTEQARQAMKPLRLAAEQARAEMQAAFAVEPFDPARLEKATGDVIAADSAVRRAGASILTTAMGQMTAAERAQFLLWRKSHEHDPPQPPGPPPAPKAP